MDKSYLLILIDKVELRGEEIKIEIQYAILTRSIVDVLVDLVFILYADHTFYESTMEGRDYVVPDIAREIGIFPCVYFVFDCSLEIERMRVAP